MLWVDEAPTTVSNVGPTASSAPPGDATLSLSEAPAAPPPTLQMLPTTDSPPSLSLSMPSASSQVAPAALPSTPLHVPSNATEQPEAPLNSRADMGTFTTGVDPSFGHQPIPSPPAFSGVANQMYTFPNVPEFLGTENATQASMDLFDFPPDFFNPTSFLGLDQNIISNTQFYSDHLGSTTATLPMFSTPDVNTTFSTPHSAPITGANPLPTTPIPLDVTNTTAMNTPDSQTTSNGIITAPADNVLVTHPINGSATLDKTQSKKRKRSYEEENAHCILPDGQPRARKPRVDKNNVATAASPKKKGSRKGRKK